MGTTSITKKWRYHQALRNICAIMHVMLQICMLVHLFNFISSWYDKHGHRNIRTGYEYLESCQRLHISTWGNKTVSKLSFFLIFLQAKAKTNHSVNAKCLWYARRLCCNCLYMFVMRNWMFLFLRLPLHSAGIHGSGMSNRLGSKAFAWVCSLCFHLSFVIVF